MPFPTEAQFVIGVQQLVFSTTWMTPLVIFFARGLIGVNALFALLLLSSRRPFARHAVVEAAWTLGVALFLTAFIAYVIQRARPFLDVSDIRLLIPIPFNTSFPSGHTAASVAMALALWRGSRTIGLCSLVVAGFIAFSRVAVGVHYPSDLFGGAMIGLVSFVLVRVGHRALRDPHLFRGPPSQDL